MFEGSDGVELEDDVFSKVREHNDEEYDTRSRYEDPKHRKAPYFDPLFFGGNKEKTMEV